MTRFGGKTLLAAAMVWSIGTCTVVLNAQGVPPRATLKGVDLDGHLHRLGERGDTKAVVVLFLSTQCPISNSYVPQLNGLVSQYRRRGVELYGVISDPAVTRDEAQKHHEAYRIRFPVLFDGSGEMRRTLKPTHTPHAFVMNTLGQKLYVGAIDDRFIKVGQKRNSATQHFLADAIKAVVTGEQVAVRRTTPVGCLLEEPPDKTKSGGVTYTRDIAPIIQANCASCHRPGQSGPFSLLTYDDVSRHARQIVEVTRSRFMPPWKPAPGYGRFLDERRLTDHELSLLEAWVTTGKPTGNPADLPADEKHVEDWRLGEPDQILHMRDVFSIPPSGPDIRRYFVIPTRLDEHRLITAIDFQPGTPQAIHHASFYLDTHRAGRKLDDEDPEPGYAGFGGPRFPDQGTLRSWFPGMTPRRLPKGMGRLVPRRSDIVAEIHYVCTGKAEEDRSRIGLYFAPRSARQLVVEIQVGNKEIEIPPGVQRHHERASYTLPVDTTLLDVVPHMHVLGREMKVAATLPDGTTEPLVWVKDWDFDWQSQYSYAQPVHLPKGSRLDVDAWYDNSSNNPLNPNTPPRTVYWGEDATDEMLICHFQCTCKTLPELKRLTTHFEQYFVDAQDHDQREKGKPKQRKPAKRRPFR